MSAGPSPAGSGARLPAVSNVRGGSNMPKLKVGMPSAPDRKPVHYFHCHCGSRVSASAGGAIMGRYGEPIVVRTIPSAPVVRPRQKVGHYKSAGLKGFTVPIKTPRTLLGS